MAEGNIRTVQELRAHVAITMTMRCVYLAPEQSTAAEDKLIKKYRTLKRAPDEIARKYLIGQFGIRLAKSEF
jgi:hypothetical protein